VPAPSDQGSLDGDAYAGRGYDEADVSDKPAWVQGQPPLSEWGQDKLDELRTGNQEGLETLAAVDRATSSILAALDRLGLAQDLLVAFTSDNSSLWGEHRLVALLLTSRRRVAA